MKWFKCLACKQTWSTIGYDTSCPHCGSSKTQSIGATY